MSNDARAIVSVKRWDLTQTTDFELATDHAVEELVSRIAQALGWEGPYEIFADPPGRVLSSTETLAEAGIADGASITLQLPGSRVVTPPTQQGQPYIWKRLDHS
jgi:hypothetical protein